MEQEQRKNLQEDEGDCHCSSVDYPDWIEAENPGSLRIALDVMLACGSTKAKAIVGALLEKGAISSKGASRSTRYTLSWE